MKVAFPVFNRSASVKLSSGRVLPARLKPVAAIKKAVSDMGSKFRRAMSTLQPVGTSEPHRTRNGAVYSRIPSSRPVSHTQVSMPADPAVTGRNEFPFQVNYDLATVPVAECIEPSIDDPGLRAALRGAIQSRQGVFEWVRNGREGLRQQLEQRLGENDCVFLGQGFVVHGLSGMNDQGEVHQWRLLVSAPAADRFGEVDTFSIPITEVKVPAYHASNGELLSRSEQAQQSHLLNVDAPYQDSTENPLVLSSGCDELAGLHALQTEVSSRIQAGLISSQSALAATVHELAPVFMDRARRDSVPVLTSALQRRLADHVSSCSALVPSVLASKRHFPAAPQSAKSEANLTSHTELTLAGKAPMCRPSERAAFRQVAGDNHCGIASVNGFFQAGVMSSAQAVNHILNTYAPVFGVDDLADLNLPGLYHPQVIEAMQRGQSVVMTREEFTGAGGGLANHDEFEALFVDSPVEQWNALCNYRFQDATAGSRPGSLEITPELWLSAATGIHADSLESILNQFLQTKANQPQWSAYPDRVERAPVGDLRARERIEGQVQRLLESRNTGANDDTTFPMICMNHGHYFAVARAGNGDWLKLDSNGTQVTGVQRAQLFAARGGLAQALGNHGVIHVICEPLQS